jgi:hypothetical protein
VAGVQAEDRPAVRGDVADLAEPLVEAGGRLQVRHVDEVVDLPGPLPALVDGGDLHRQQEADRGAAGRREPVGDRPLQLAGQAEQPRLGRHQAFLQLLEPARMGEVAGADDADALALRPQCQVLQVAVAAARP